MKQFINSKTKEIISLTELCVLLNASIPETVRYVGDWEEFNIVQPATPKAELKELAKVADTARERGWREEELFYTDTRINILEDDNLDSKVWREYRKSLRQWPAHKNFPKEKYRPKRPE